MINKFQQGGKQQDALTQFILGLALTLQVDPNLIVQIALQNPDALKQAAQVYLQTQDMNQAAQTFAQAIQQQTQAARHGAKLQYLKSLKHQCAEDEELYYYKKGGKVGCGCKKKEDGGEVTKAQKGTTIKKFKNDYSSKRIKDSEDDYFKGTADHTKTKSNKPVQKFKTRTKAELDKINKLSEDDYFAGTADHTKPGKKVSKKCGGAVEKFKKHRNGGSLNGIPFMLEGTPKAGIRYKGGKKDSFENENHENVDVIMGQRPNFYTHAPLISRIISSDGNDTTFVEVPEHGPFTTVKPRAAKNNWTEDLINNKKIYNNSPEYYTMRRRFSEASLAAPGKFKLFVPKPYTPLKYSFGN